MLHPGAQAEGVGASLGTQEILGAKHWSLVPQPNRASASMRPALSALTKRLSRYRPGKSRCSRKAESTLKGPGGVNVLGNNLIKEVEPHRVITVTAPGLRFSGSVPTSGRTKLSEFPSLPDLAFLSFL